MYERAEVAPAVVSSVVKAHVNGLGPQEFPETPSVADLEEIVRQVLDAAAAVTAPLFRRTLAVHDRGRGGAFDPVTPADRWAERAMRELLACSVPAHRIEGQEEGVSGPAEANGFRWMLDPIAGTKSFVAGIPLWGTLVSVWDGMEPLVGGIDHPALGERFVGSLTGAKRICADGAESPVTARPCTGLAESVMCAPGNDEAGQLSRRVRIARYSADCYAYGLLASGLVDLVVDSELSLHEVAAIVPLVTAAGGVVTDWSGGRDFASGRIVAAGDRRVHAEALSHLL